MPISFNSTFFPPASNQLTGNIPSEFGKITTLKQAKFGSNEFEETLPIEFSLISGLKHLSFGMYIPFSECIYALS